MSDHPIRGAEAVPADLLQAFDAYERAIMINDLDALDDAFAPGPGSMRGDNAGLLVGHDAISAFRGTRGGVPPRVIERVEYRELGPGVALLISVSRFNGGGTGLQTQVWQLIDGQWLITAAHVTPRAQALDRSVWRSVGDPLWQGAWEGPLAGLTVAVKDLFAVKGYRIGAGNPTFLNESRAEKTMAPAVGDLIQGGASLRGIARTDEFAYSIAGDNAHYGTPPNGAVAGALPGGSSSGVATAVATGQAEIGLATDTAGSIRVPASYQGLWGLRTTHGLVPRQGLLPLAQSFDTVGWLTRRGDVLARVVDWCLNSDETITETPSPDLDLTLRFAVPVEVLAATEPDTRSAFEELTGRLQAIGAEVTEVELGDLDDYYEPFRLVQGAEAWRNNGDWVDAHPGALGAAVAERFATAAKISEQTEDDARAQLGELRARLRDLVGDTVIWMPTVPGPAPMWTAKGDRVDAVRHATLRMTTPAAIGGLPALSIPLLSVDSQLGPAPVGACVISAPGSDAALVRLGLQLADRLAPDHERTS